MTDKKKRLTKELWVGVLGIIAILLVYLLINFFKGINVFEDNNKYYIKFDNLGDVVKTSPIYIRGYKVGNVCGISYDYNKGDGVYVEISVDNSLRIPEGSTATINSQLLGSSTVDLTLGSSKTILMPGDTLTGHTAGSVMTAAGDMMPQISALIPKADSIMTSLNTILANPAINGTLSNMESLTKELDRTANLLNGMLENDMKDIAGNVEIATGKLIELEDDLLTISSQLSEVDYLALVESLENSLNNIEKITSALDNGEGTAGMLLKDSTLYHKLTTTCDAANALLQDLKENPKRYVHFSVFGRKEKKE